MRPDPRSSLNPVGDNASIELGTSLGTINEPILEVGTDARVLPEKKKCVLGAEPVYI
jgi:hypothetical protein